MKKNVCLGSNCRDTSILLAILTPRAQAVISSCGMVRPFKGAIFDLEAMNLTSTSSSAGVADLR